MYIKKVEIFNDCNPAELQNKVNGFLKQEIELAITIVDIQFSNAGTGYACMIYYTQGEPENGEDNL